MTSAFVVSLAETLLNVNICGSTSYCVVTVPEICNVTLRCSGSLVKTTACCRKFGIEWVGEYTIVTSVVSPGANSVLLNSAIVHFVQVVPPALSVSVLWPTLVK